MQNNTPEIRFTNNDKVVAEVVEVGGKVSELTWKEADYYEALAYCEAEVEKWHVEYIILNGTPRIPTITINKRKNVKREI